MWRYKAPAPNHRSHQHFHIGEQIGQAAVPGMTPFGLPGGSGSKQDMDQILPVYSRVFPERQSNSSRRKQGAGGLTCCIFTRFSYRTAPLTRRPFPTQHSFPGREGQRHAWAQPAFKFPSIPARSQPPNAQQRAKQRADPIPSCRACLMQASRHNSAICSSSL